jgi:2-succinyl-6-hydroxy-2,4-cyclohexadiene-1-carboxylate synthase
MAQRIVFLHGFTQTAASWSSFKSALRPLLGDGAELLALDAPGHGELADVHLDLVAGARLLGDLGGRATYIGYSMGGRFGLHLALDRPELVERLVLIGATPGIEDATERAARGVADDERADRIERIGIEAFLDEWLAQPLFASLPADQSGRSARLTNTAAGLAASLRLAGTGHQTPLWDRLGHLTMPVLVMAGEHDAKFSQVGTRMTSMIERATFTAVPGAGHAAHLERPDAAARLVADWLAATQPPIANPAANATP